MTIWRKSSYSTMQDNDCVEVATFPAHTGVRDSKERDRGHVSVSRSAWTEFIGEVAASQVTES